MADVTVSRGYPATPNTPVGTVLTSPPTQGGPQGSSDPQGLVEKNLQFLQRPDVQAGLLGFGISMLQGTPPGQTDLGAFGTSIGRGVNAAGQVQAAEQKQQQQGVENKLAERKVGADEARAGAAVTSAATEKSALDLRAQQFADEFGLKREQFASDNEYRAKALELDRIKANADSVRAQAAVEGNTVRREQLVAQARQFDAQLEQAKTEFSGKLPLLQAQAGADVTRALAATTEADAAKTRAETERTVETRKLDQQADQFAQSLAATKEGVNTKAAADVYKTMLEYNVFNNMAPAQMQQTVLDVLNAASGKVTASAETDAEAEAKAVLSDPVKRAELVTRYGEASVQKRERQLGLRK